MARKKKPLISEKDVVKATKKIGKGVIILAVAGFILFIILLLLGIKLRFIVSDDLLVSLEPKHQTLITQKNSAVLNFTLKNNNIGSCKSICNIAVYSVADNRLLTSRNYTMGHNGKVAISYEYFPPALGHGQIIYRLLASCSNINQGLCLSDEKPRYKSSLVFLNYDLSDEELDVKVVLNKSITEFSGKLLNATLMHQRNRLLLQRLPDGMREKSSINQTLNALRSRIEAMQHLADEYIILWSEEKYTSVNFTRFDDSIFAGLTDAHNDIVASIEIGNMIADAFSAINITGLEQADRFYSINGMGRHHFALDQAAKIVYEDYLKLGGSFDSALEKDVELHAINLQDEIDKAQVAASQGQADIEFAQKLFSLKNALFSTDISICRTHEMIIDTAERLNDFDIPENQSVDIGEASRLLVEAALGNIDVENRSIFDFARIDTDRFERFMDSNCGDDVPAQWVNKLLAADLSLEKSEVGVPILEIPEFELDEPPPRCCAYNRCDACDAKPDIVLFIHGHAMNEWNNPEYSMNAFGKLQQNLHDDGIIDGGEFEFTQYDLHFPISFRATFYYIPTYDVGSFNLIAQKSERIENYALRLKEIVDHMKQHGNVTIVAHSMGGLVARNYLDIFGTDGVEKLITVNTPHHGVSGNVQRFCNVLGATEECDDLSAGSVFLTRLNAKNPPDIELYNIHSRGCDMDGQDGDGIVVYDTATYEGAEDFTIDGRCTDRLQTDLHSNVLDPELYPEFYEHLLEILKA